MRTSRLAAIGILAVAFYCSVDAMAGVPAGIQQTPAQPASAAPAIKLPPDTLDKLLAPVALYPDQLLSQMLIAAATPARVQELSGWLVRNATLAGTKAQDAAKQHGFESAYVILVLFPQVVNYMADNITWTKELGQAFTADRQGVLDSVQRLRAQSQKAGTLKTTPQQTVETKTTSGGDQVIVIEPANPQVVYVPQYNPQVVYTQPSTSTVVIKEESNTTEAIVGAAIGFTAGIAIGAAMDNNYYYGPYGWHGSPYMYNDDWDDFYDDRQEAREDFYENREDAREDIADNRENVTENRSERATTAQQERTERQQTRQTPEAQAQRDQKKTDAKANAESRAAGTSTRGTGSANAEARGTERPEGSATRERPEGSATRERPEGSATRERPEGSATRERPEGNATSQRASGDRSGTRSDAFSGYSSGRSERSASSRGQRSRSSSSGGGRSRRR